MNKLMKILFLFLFPSLVLADNSLSFAPPPGDFSVVFLGNLFGVVDGVLSGSGSQIMGAMFAVFNSAVLTIGGMIIMYTLMVATMNTAHEGQMLGQKWSSIWIPVRSTIGLALLVPKASGYCLMQIGVMWIVLQGVGAADKVWEAALSYLNRGGLIIQAQGSLSTALTVPTDLLSANNGSNPAGAYAVSNILSGQVCMLALQKQLEAKRKEYLDDLQTKKTSICDKPADYRLAGFCTNAVPDFLSTFDVVTAQNKNNYSMPMPNFPVNSDYMPYFILNGICGNITWKSVSGDGLTGATSPQTAGDTVSVNGANLSADELQSAKLSRAIAIQQVFVSLSNVAIIMVNNNPALTPSSNQSSSTTPSGQPKPPPKPPAYYIPLYAKQQFGVPYTSLGAQCKNYSDGCISWGPLKNTFGVLFSGTELQGAINDYNGIMAPTFNLIKASQDQANATNTRAFITTANSQGWMMAGAYFFDLVNLNGNAAASGVQIDTGSGSGLNGSTGPTIGNKCPNYGPISVLCMLLGSQADTILANVNGLLTGGYTSSTQQPQPMVDSSSTSNVKSFQMAPQSGQENLDTSVYGFINNSLMVQLPGQPGTAPLQFANMISITVDPKPMQLPDLSFDCGSVKIVFFRFCLGEMMGDLFYNYLMRPLFNFFTAIFQQLISQVIMAFLTVPLTGIASIFKQGLNMLTVPGINPVVALAQMGTMYINFAANLWMMILFMAVNPFFFFALPLLALCLPLLLAWLTIMVSVGFTTAYYVPILPYMIFTFGVLAWIMSVIEAMVAAPIVALGVTHPEGHDAFGKAEAAIMLLMNVFLRPAMMIIGYISGIALCYVGVWVLNAGFDHAIGFIENGGVNSPSGMFGYTGYSQVVKGTNEGLNWYNSLDTSGSGNGSVATASSPGTGGGYNDWAGIYAYFFSILIYTTMYVTIVQQAFTMISVLPDKVLRWIGGTPEGVGQESAKWGDQEVKGKTQEAGKSSADAQGQMGKQMGAGATKALGGLGKGGKKGSAKASGGKPAEASASKGGAPGGAGPGT